ncbi:MAG: Gfo/Idh/MocA family oxidoreductase [Verrucomicrobiae bacterium]|nr:Gfo/Idh/MocA family oxidoreductase [Verrucomicrobiae bacterium]
MKRGSIRMAVVGCGHITRTVHLPVLRKLGVEVVAVADPDEANRQQALTWAPGAKAVPDVGEALRTNCDAVLVATPTSSHGPVGLAVLEAGRHLYMEKPLAMSLEEAAMLVRARERFGVVAMMGFNYRFNPLVERVRCILRSGRLGAVRRVRSWFTTPVRPMPMWRQARASGGGALLELGSHHFDWVPWVMGRQPVCVEAVVRSERVEMDWAGVKWELEGGVRVESLFSVSAASDADGMELECERGSLRFDRYRNRSVWLSGWRWLARVPGAYWWRRMRTVGNEPSYERAWRAFIEAVQAGAQVSPSIEDGYRSLRWVLAAEESARVGRPVTLE